MFRTRSPKALVVLFMAMGLGLPAQILYDTYTGLDGIVSLSEIELLPNGDLILAGYSGDSLLLLRATAPGTSVWSRVYPDVRKAQDLRVSTNGSISVVTGPIDPAIHVFEPTLGDPVQMLAMAGSHEWVTQDSLVYISGAFNGGISPQFLNYGHVDGGVAWSTPLTFETAPGGFRPGSVTVNGNGSIIVCGFMENNSVSNGLRYWVGQYTAEGALSDSVGFQAWPTSSRASRVIPTPDGGFLAYGMLGTTRPIWVKGDSSGAIEYVRDWWTNVDDGNYDILCLDALHAAIRSDGSLVMGVALNCNDPYPPRALVEMNNNGLVNCVRVFPSTVNRESFGDLIVDQDDVVHVVGSPNYGFDSYPPNDTWMGIATICDGMVGAMENRLGQVMNVHPQPSNGIFTIQPGVYDPGTLVADVFGVSGRRIERYEITYGSFNIDLSDHPPGVYHLRLSNENGVVGVSQLLLAD